MKTNKSVIGAMLASLGAALLCNHIQNISTKRRRTIIKKLAKEEINTWEGEGGAIVNRPSRATLA